jgi:hypothetical protein
MAKSPELKAVLKTNKKVIKYLRQNNSEAAYRKELDLLSKNNKELKLLWKENKKLREDIATNKDLGVAQMIQTHNLLEFACHLACNDYYINAKVKLLEKLQQSRCDVLIAGKPYDISICSVTCEKANIAGLVQFSVVFEEDNGFNYAHQHIGDWLYSLSTKTNYTPIEDFKKSWMENAPQVS